MSDQLIMDTVNNGSGWQARDFNGWFQAREIVNGKPGKWRFYVAGFSGHNDSIARVRRTKEGEYAFCNMDAKNRLNIDGKWYNSRQWDH